MTKREMIVKIRESTVKIDGVYFVEYKKILDIVSELEERPIIIKTK